MAVILLVSLLIIEKQMLLRSHQGKIQGIQQADARALAEWDYAVPLDESIGIERVRWAVTASTLRLLISHGPVCGMVYAPARNRRGAAPY